MKKIIIEIDEPCYEDAINDTEWDTLSLGIYLKELVKNSKPLQTELEDIKAELHKRIKIQYDACFGNKGDVACFHQAYEVSGIIVDNVFEDRIAELKGE